MGYVKKIFFLTMVFISFLLNSQDIKILKIESDLSQNNSYVEFFISLPDGFYQSYSPDYFNITIKENSYFKIKDILYPENFVQGEKLSGDIVLKVYLVALKDISPKDIILDFNINYQLCDKTGICFRPQTVTQTVEVIVKNSIAVSSFSTLLFFILFAFLGGLLLNIMPCVLPVLSIKAFSLLKQSELTKKEIFFNSLIYSAGVILSLLILATVVAVIKIMGNQIGWGFQFQNPKFVIFLILTLFIFAFSMFDFIIISIPDFGNKKINNKFLESFFTGILAVLLATPCTAPFLGSALGFSFSQPVYIIFIIFFFIGVGLSFPFLLLGIFPQAIKLLPKPGNWMNYFKEVMGFFLFATVIWLISVLFYQIGIKNLILFLFYLLVIVFCLWIFRNWVNSGKNRKVRIISIFLIFFIATASAFFLIKVDSKSEVFAESQNLSYAKKFSEEEVNSSLLKKEKVFLIFSAKWCMTCQTNEATVLKTNEVEEFFNKNGITVFYGDWTNKDTVTGNWIKKFGKAGVPVYVYYDENGNFFILSELLTKNMILNLGK